jgi:hypothetical protein
LRAFRPHGHRDALHTDRFTHHHLIQTILSHTGLLTSNSLPTLPVEILSVSSRAIYPSTPVPAYSPPHSLPIFHYE